MEAEVFPVLGEGCKRIGLAHAIDEIVGERHAFPLVEEHTGEAIGMVKYLRAADVEKFLRVTGHEGGCSRSTFYAGDEVRGWRIGEGVARGVDIRERGEAEGILGKIFLGAVFAAGGREETSRVAERCKRKGQVCAQESEEIGGVMARRGGAGGAEVEVPAAVMGGCGVGSEPGIARAEHCCCGRLFGLPNALGAGGFAHGVEVHIPIACAAPGDAVEAFYAVLEEKYVAAINFFVDTFAGEPGGVVSAPGTESGGKTNGLRWCRGRGRAIESRIDVATGPNDECSDGWWQEPEEWAGKPHGLSENRGDTLDVMDDGDALRARALASTTASAGGGTRGGRKRGEGVFGGSEVFRAIQIVI